MKLFSKNTRILQYKIYQVVNSFHTKWHNNYISHILDMEPWWGLLLICPKQVVLIGSPQMFNSSKSHHPDEKLKDDHRIVMCFYTCERM